MEEKLLSKSFEPHDVEAKWYRHWLDCGYFRAEDKSERKPFSIVIPPPNVTGILHMGHALNNVLQDVIVRYKRMQGYNTLWMPGMDHAGIATQNVVEQQLAKEGLTRHDLGREKFIERIWEWKEKYGGVIMRQLRSLGCSCDWPRERFTMDEGLTKAVREVFVRLYNDDLIYQGNYIVNWCPRCHTAISDLEVEYEEEEGGLWDIRYPFTDGSGEIIVATTRPETMLGDTAVAVNPRDKRYRDAVGKEVVLPLVNRRIPVIADDYVSMEFGSGAVKITPASDPNDFAMAQRHDLEIIKIMDDSAVINENGGIYSGQDRYECRKNVVHDLEKEGYLAGRQPYTHNVGHCYRCKTAIEPAVSRQWFVKVKPLARAATAAVVKGKTRLIPSTWEGTYFEWMENIRDWCISRQIWWGHRIPVWHCDGCGNVIVSVDDPDKCPVCEGASLHQEEDVLDTWFSSALWPFSTLGWPERTEALKTFYPTSLLVTGFDILFFWVARMMMMGLYIMKDVPFKDVYLHALVRDEAGDKMSKSKGNSIDPLEMIEKYGTDAFRFTLAAFTTQGRDVRMSEERIEGYRHFVTKIWNAVRFSMMNLGDYLSPDVSHTERTGNDYSLCDRWIKDRLNKTIGEVTKYLDEYRFGEAAGSIYYFVWHEFCDWYLELAKPVLYSKDDPAKRLAAQRTLHFVLKTAVSLLHPFMPFLTEEIRHKLGDNEDSVMISRFPVVDEMLCDRDAEKKMGVVMDLIACIRNIRSEMNILPSIKLKVVVSSPDEELIPLITAGEDYIINLANLEELTVAGKIEEPIGAATGVAGHLRVFVSLKGTIDAAAEKIRIEKRIGKIDRDMVIVSKKLANRDFMEKAAGEVIEKAEAKFRELKEKSGVLETALKRLQEMEAQV